MNSIKITVYDKKIVGCISYMNKYIYFDKDGYFVEQSTEKLENVPYVTGIDFNEIKLYEKMKVDRDEIFNVVMNITKLISKYEISVSEIQFNHFFELTLYSGDIEILLGKHTTYDEQIAKLSGVLKEAEGMKGILHLENYSDSSSNIIFEKK
jgi:cell division protein FtsQ